MAKKVGRSLVYREKPAIEDVEAPLEDSSDGNTKFARALGSPHYHTREKGLKALGMWLSRREDVSEEELLKIWKGLFYCFWHSDLVPVQSELANRLAAFVESLPQGTAHGYFCAMLRTLRREWLGIDKLRLDKFLMLVRRFVAAAVRACAAAEWDLALCNLYCDGIEAYGLLPEDGRPARGLQLHLCDLFIDELGKVACMSPPPSDALALWLSPFAAYMQRAETEGELVRAMDGVIKRLVASCVDPPEEKPFRNLDFVQLSTILFNLGAEPGVKARNRKHLYNASRALDFYVQQHAASSSHPPAKRAKRSVLATEPEDDDMPSTSPMTEATHAEPAASRGAGRKKGATPSKRDAPRQATASPESPQQAALTEATARRKAMPAAKTPRQATPAATKASKQAAVAATCTPKQATPAANKTPKQAGRPKQATPGATKTPKQATPAVAKTPKQATPAVAKTPKQATPAVAKTPKQATSAAAKTPKQAASGKKGRKDKGLQEGCGAEATPATAKRKRSQATTGPSPSTPPTRSNGAATPGTGKRLQWNLKKNLVFPYGSPAPPNDVVNPPGAKPCGSALKKTSALTSKGTPATIRARMATPKTARRAAAQDFF